MKKFLTILFFAMISSQIFGYYGGYLYLDGSAHGDHTQNVSESGSKRVYCGNEDNAHGGQYCVCCESCLLDSHSGNDH